MLKDRVCYHHVPNTPGLVLGDARYREFRFDRHYHLDYHIGLVSGGVQRQTFKGRSVLLGHGRISVMPPDEIHDGASADGGAYRMRTFRLSPALLNEVAEEISGAQSEPRFGGAMIEDSALSYRLLQVHGAMRDETYPTPLLVEEKWLQLFEPLFLQLRAIPVQSVVGGLSVRHLRRVKDYCHANLAEKIGLQQLAQLCGVSRFQFLRRFTQSTGLTPHAWLVRLRLERACSILNGASGSIVARVALDVGFYDQSHFNRAFRRAYGVAPLQYRSVRSPSGAR